MKMSNVCYADLKSDIEKVADSFSANMGAEKLLDYVSSRPVAAMLQMLHEVSHNRAFNDSHPHYQAGKKRILPHDGRDFCWYYKDGMGLDDTHIQTALLKIKKEIFPTAKL
jgi:hypothetical protein